MKKYSAKYVMERAYRYHQKPLKNIYTGWFVLQGIGNFAFLLVRERLLPMNRLVFEMCCYSPILYRKLLDQILANVMTHVREAPLSEVSEEKSQANASKMWHAAFNRPLKGV